MLNVKEHLSKLGLPAVDRITGFKGIVTSVTFDLYGCIQALINPGVDKDGKPQELTWFDIVRLNFTDKTPVMQPPDFELGAVAEGKKGPEAKPKFNKF